MATGDEILLRLTPGQPVYVTTSDAFYAPHLNGWYAVDAVDGRRRRGTLTRGGAPYLIFENERGVALIVKHAYNQHGESTWDPVTRRHRWQYLGVTLQHLAPV